jgi:hypothetical protein
MKHTNTSYNANGTEYRGYLGTLGPSPRKLGPHIRSLQRLCETQPGRHELRRITCVLNIITDGFYLASKKRSYTQEECRRATIRSEVLGKRLLYEFLIATAATTRADGLCLVAKEWAFQATELWATGRVTPVKSRIPIFTKYFRGSGSTISKSGLLILVGLGRALTKGLRRPSNEDYDRYVNRLCEGRDPPTKPKLLASLTRFTRTMLEKAKKRMEHWKTPIDPADVDWTIRVSQSACLERTRLNGGAYGYFKEQVFSRHAAANEHPNAIVRRWRDTIRQDYGRLRDNYATVSYEAAKQGVDVPNVPDAAPVLLEERGYRLRDITKQNAAIATMLSPVNQMLLRVLGGVPACKAYLLGHDPSVHLKVPYDTTRRKFFSSDWTTASDYIRFDVAAAILAGITQALELSPAVTSLLKFTTGSFRLVRTHGADAQELKSPETLGYTARGLLMGMGLAWPFLCILNCFCAEYYTRSIKGQGYLDYCVGGDDLLGFWTMERIRRYRRTATQLGLKINLRKSLVADRHGIFAENYIVAHAPREDFSWDSARSDDLTPPTWVFHREKRTVLSTVTLAKATDLYGRPTNENMPLWATIGDACTQATSSTVPLWRKKRIVECFYRRFPKALGILRGSKLPVHWPKMLGGCGMPGARRPPGAFARAAGYIARAQTEARTSLISSIETQWAFAGIPEDAATKVADMLGRVQQLPQTVEPTHPTMREVGQLATASVLAEHSLMPEGKKSTTKTLKISDISASIRRKVHHLSDKVKALNRRFAKRRVLGVGDPIERIQPHADPAIANNRIIHKMSCAGADRFVRTQGLFNRVSATDAQALLDEVKLPSVPLAARHIEPTKSIDHAPSHLYYKFSPEGEDEEPQRVVLSKPLVPKKERVKFAKPGAVRFAGVSDSSDDEKEPVKKKLAKDLPSKAKVSFNVSTIPSTKASNLADRPRVRFADGSDIESQDDES